MKCLAAILEAPVQEIHIDTDDPLLQILMTDYQALKALKPLVAKLAHCTPVFMENLWILIIQYLMFTWTASCFQHLVKCIFQLLCRTQQDLRPSEWEVKIWSMFISCTKADRKGCKNGMGKQMGTLPVGRLNRWPWGPETCWVHTGAQLYLTSELVNFLLVTLTFSEGWFSC